MVLSSEGDSDIFQLQGDLQRLIHGNRTTGDLLLKRLAFHQLQHESLGTVGLFQSVDLGDVGVVQAGQYLCFPFETGHALGIKSKHLREDLESDIAIQLGVMGAVNLTHAPFAELLLDAVMRNALTNHGKLSPLPWHLILTCGMGRGNRLM